MGTAGPTERPGPPNMEHGKSRAWEITTHRRFTGSPEITGLTRNLFIETTRGLTHKSTVHWDYNLGRNHVIPTRELPASLNYNPAWDYASHPENGQISPELRPTGNHKPHLNGNPPETPCPELGFT